MPPTTTPRVRSRHATAQLRAARLLQGVASPEILLFSSSGFSRLVALSFFLLGWWGAPCRVFLFPLGPCGLSFFWVGGFPLPCFPGVSPMFLGRGGVVFCVFVSPAISCILRLFLSLATRAIWSTDPQTPRPPPPFSLVRRS